jgi:deoxycytidylate deaminase
MSALNIALNSADKSVCRDFRHGAVCVYKGRVITRGTNITHAPHILKGERKNNC